MRLFADFDFQRLTSALSMSANLLEIIAIVTEKPRSRAMGERTRSNGSCLLSWSFTQPFQIFHHHLENPQNPLLTITKLMDDSFGALIEQIKVCLV